MTSIEFLHRAEEAEELAQCLLEFAVDLRKQSAGSEQPKLFWPNSQPALSDEIAKILTIRRRRAEHLDATLFGEPVWDMLLVLFEANLAHTDLTFEQVCRSSGSYVSTARRWMAILVDQRLVEIDGEVRDGHSKAVRLTEQGAIKMNRILLELH